MISWNYEIMNYRNYEIMNYRNYEIMIYWNYEIAIYRNYEIMIYRNYEIMIYWNYEIMIYRNYEIMIYWNFEIMNYRNYEIMNYRNYEITIALERSSRHKVSRANHRLTPTSVNNPHSSKVKSLWPLSSGDWIEVELRSGRPGKVLFHLFTFYFLNYFLLFYFYFFGSLLFQDSKQWLTATGARPMRVGKRAVGIIEIYCSTNLQSLF